MDALTPASDSSRLHGPAIYFDGTCSARNDVTIQGTAQGLVINGADGGELNQWLYAELRRQSAPEGVLRLGRHGETLLARLEVRDQALADAIEDRAATLDRGGAAERALRRKVVGLSLAAVVSLIVTAIVGVPALTNRILPLMPLAMDDRLGKAVDKEIHSALDSKHLGTAFACGTAPGELAGRAAIDRLIARLSVAAALPYHLHADVVRRNEANAFALPGGHIYVYQGLIDQADSPDEVAGVLAHEIGHVAHRDGTRTVLQTAGLSFLFGMMLGDFVGGGAVVIAAKTVLRSSYSRHVEAAADAYSVALMTKAGGDPRALGVILARIVSDKETGMKILLDHPETKDRISAINGMVPASTAATTPLLDAADWTALKQICAPQPAAAAVPRIRPVNGQEKSDQGNAKGGPQGGGGGGEAKNANNGARANH